MIKGIVRIVSIWITATLLMALSKVLFAIVAGGYSIGDVLNAMAHGLSMDMSMAGYITVIPALLAIALYFKDLRGLRLTAKIYFGIVSFAMALGILANASLYPYWGFPLDMTPVFYIMSSPSAAMASMTWWQGVIAVIGTGLLAWLFYLTFSRVYFSCCQLKNSKKYGINQPTSNHSSYSSPKIWKSAVLVILTAALLIPIRGGFTVSTMNVSRAYFSDNMRLNHAAVNPLFNFMYSATHQGNFSKQFHFMDGSEAETAFNALTQNPESSLFIPNDSIVKWKGERPALDIQLIILESFSSHLLPIQGGEAVATRLDSIAREGWLFRNFYASSFRTDRALPAILNGYPAQPTTSIMKWVNKLDSLPSIGRSLKNAGYQTSYYYGGDVNFTNMNALLVAGGFDKIVKDKDFSLSERMSKWGAHDDVLFQRVWEEQKSTNTEQPKFTVIQTSSSHEPFEVPYKSSLPDERANAFAFTDSCLGAYIDSLKTLPNYERMLIAIVPDHYGAYPRGLEEPLARHHIPFVITGGAINDIEINPEVLDKIGNQTDIAATLLFLAGIDSSDFKFSNNMLNPCRRSYAFFSEPSQAVLITNQGINELSVETKDMLQKVNAEQELWLKAYLQTLYNDIDAR